MISYEEAKKIVDEHERLKLNAETVNINDRDVLNGVQMLGKSLNEIIEFCGNEKNGVELIDDPMEIYEIAMSVKQNRNEYPKLYKDIFEDYQIWSLKISEDIVLVWNFWGRDRPFLNSYGLSSYGDSGRGALLSRRKIKEEQKP